MLQHQAAATVGMPMPETLYTNSPREVRAFVRRKGGQVVYKPFMATAWGDATQRWMPYTALLHDETLIADNLRLTPGIFQELVPKSHEVRITMMGRRGFSAAIYSQETSTGRLDWRRAGSELRLEPIEAPQVVEERCVALLEELGLVFGCFDFVVTPDGHYLFLEVNEAGQFLFVERTCGLPLLDAFSSFLCQAAADFSWCAEDVAVRYSDPAFEEAILGKAAAFSRAHVATPPRVIREEEVLAPSRR